MRDAYITSVARKMLIGADASIPWYILLALLMPALYARAIGRRREIRILPANPKRRHNQLAISLSTEARLTRSNRLLWRARGLYSESYDQNHRAARGDVAISKSC